MDPRTFLDIENAITRRLWAAWRPYAADLYAKVSEMIDKGDFGGAYDVAKNLDLTPIAEENREWIKFHLLSAAIFGASNANAQGDDVNIVSLGQHSSLLDRVADEFLTAVEWNATTQVYNGLVQLIAEHEKDQTVTGEITQKADNEDRFLKKYVDFRESGDAALQLQSSLHTARLAVWGFTAEADVRGVSTYRLQAVLDGRTSRFCEYIDGKTFKVADARKRITDALSVQDPNDLKTIQPWPNQSKSGLDQIKEYSNDELSAMGYAVPPFHPNCRTLCVLVSQEVAPVEEADTPESQKDQLGDIPYSDATTSTFNELDMDFTDDEVDYWNQEMGISPISTLAELSGSLPADVLQDFAGKDAIQITDNGDISFTLNGDFAGSGSNVSMNLIYDPVKNLMDLNYLNLAGTSPQHAAGYVDDMFTKIMNVAVSVGASKLALRAVGADAIIAQASMGFVPEAAGDWYALKTSILADLEGSLKYVKTDLSAAQYQALTDVLHSQDPTAFLVLAELPYTVKGQSIANLLLQGRSMDMVMDVGNSYQSEQFFS